MKTENCLIIVDGFIIIGLIILFILNCLDTYALF